MKFFEECVQNLNAGDIIDEYKKYYEDIRGPRKIHFDR